MQNLPCLASGPRAGMLLLALAVALPNAVRAMRDSFEAIGELVASRAKCPDFVKVSGSQSNIYHGDYVKVATHDETTQGEQARPVYKSSVDYVTRYIYFLEKKNQWCIGTDDWYLAEVVAKKGPGSSLQPDPERHVGIYEFGNLGSSPDCPNEVGRWYEMGEEGGVQDWVLNDQIQVIIGSAPRKGILQDLEQMSSVDEEAWYGKEDKEEAEEGDEKAMPQPPGPIPVMPAQVEKGNLRQYMKNYPIAFRDLARRGIPDRLRWKVWKDVLEIPNRSPTEDERGRFARTKDRTCKHTNLIEQDLARTFLTEELKQEHYDRLKHVLTAYACDKVASDGVGYVQGMNFWVFFTMHVSRSLEDEIWVKTFMEKIMERDSSPLLGGSHKYKPLTGFFKVHTPLLLKYIEACKKLVASKMPGLSAHLKNCGADDYAFLQPSGWFGSLFVTFLPLRAVKIIWDAVICEGLLMLLKIAVAMFQVMEDSLLALSDVFEMNVVLVKAEDFYFVEGGLNALRFGQRLVSLAAKVEIPEDILRGLQ